MNTSVLRLCSWGGIATMVLLLVGLAGFAGFLPPPAPAMDAAAVAAMYSKHNLGIKFGMILVALAAAFLMPYIAAITVQMRRAEGSHSPLAYIQLGLGALLVIEFIIPAFASLAAAYRTDRAPEITQALNDLCWLMFVGVVSTAVLQVAVIAVAILSDRSPNPVFPRWVGYFNVWAAILFCPGVGVAFFKLGPMAWNGLFTWWMPLTAFGIWFIVMTWQLLTTIRKQEKEQASETATAGGEFEEEIAVLMAQLTALRARVETHDVDATHNERLRG